MGFVYVMECKSYDGKTFCKVGISENDPARRKFSIQTGCPFEIKRTWVSRNIPDYKECEIKIHNELIDFKTRGEWFCIPFVRACYYADKICKDGLHTYAEKIIQSIKDEQQKLKMRLIALDKEINNLHQEIKSEFMGVK